MENIRRLAVFVVVVMLLLQGCATVDYKRIAQDRRTQYVQSHNTLPQWKVEHITQGLINVGMTKEEVIASWGNPRIYEGSISHYNNGSDEFIYYNGQYPYEYMLHFIDGKLYSWTKQRRVDSY